MPQVVTSRRNLLTASAALGAASLLDQPALAASRSRAERALAAKLDGRVIARGAPDYEAARLGKGMTPVGNRYPALIVQAASTRDVVRTVRYAQAHHLDLSVRSGGHDLMAASTTPTGLMLDLASMNKVVVDPLTGIARVGAGARAGELVTAGHKHGWVPVVGANANVGIGGLTLGGGMGWFAGIFGATVDSMIAAEVVTADGRILKASNDQNPDLFWALRGGGGNFGVVTEFTLQMRRVPRMLAGAFGYEVEPRKFLNFYRDFMASIPDALHVEMALPLGPRQTAYLGACWLGDEREGLAALRPLLDYAKPTTNTLAVQSYSDFALGKDAGLQDTILQQGRLYWQGGAFAGISDEVIEAYARIAGQPAMEGCYLALAHYMHGQLCRPAPGSTPFIRPAGNVCFAACAGWNDGAPEAEIRRKTEWTDAAAKMLEPMRTKLDYINYLSVPTDAAVRDAYGQNYQRLLEIKRKYDHFNVFHNNRNINPA